MVVIIRLKTDIIGKSQPLLTFLALKFLPSHVYLRRLHCFVHELPRQRAVKHLAADGGRDKLSLGAPNGQNMQVQRSRQAHGKFLETTMNGSNCAMFSPRACSASYRLASAANFFPLCGV